MVLTGAADPGSPGDAADLQDVVTSLRYAWEIDTVPGRTVYRRNVLTVDGREPPNPIRVDLNSASALAWLLRNTADAVPPRRGRSEAQRRQLAVERLAFELAEGVWGTDQDQPELHHAVRVEPDGAGGYAVRAVRLGG